MLEAGNEAPDFSLQATDGKTVTLADFKGKNVVLYFYPRDMTPGCTTEACDFRDQNEKFKEIGTVVIGISPDPIEKHQKFTKKHNLPFTLLADTEHETAKAYGAWQLKKTFGNEYWGIIRSTFVIDKDGKIVKVWSKVKVKDHVQEVYRFIKENLA